MGRFDEGMGRVDPEVGEHIERSKPYARQVHMASRRVNRRPSVV